MTGLPSALGNTALVVVSGVLTLRLGLLVVAAVVELVRRRRDPLPLDGPLPPVAVIVPAYNEARVLAGTVKSLLACDHPDLQVVLVDDGSTDATASVAIGLAARHPRVRAVIQPRNGGKAAALNAGIAASTAPHVVTVDADTLLDPRALRRLCAPLLRPDVDAVASNVKVGNRLSWITRWQSLEYVVGINLGRRGQAGLNCITTIPGAACAFRRDALTAVGGFSSDTVVEDTDLTLTLLEAGRRVVYQPAAVAFTEAPDTIGALFRQRTRWLRGYVQCLWKHRRAFLRLDALGWFGMPNLLFTHVLVFLVLPGSVPPLVELLAWAGWGPFFGALIGLFGLDVGLAAAAYAVDREDFRELLVIPVRRVFWPAFQMVVFVVVWARIVTGVRPRWGRQARRGELADAGAKVVKGRP